MIKHTPGPWDIHNIDNPSLSIAIHPLMDEDGDHIIAEIPLDADGDKQANAKLIAAAPDMYKELRILLVELITWLEDEETGKHVAIDMLARLQSVKSMLDKLEVSGG